MADLWHVLDQSARPMLLGTIVLVMGAILGWKLSQYDRWLVTRWVSWWLNRVVLPLLESKSWARRALTIFTNNASMAAVTVALGYWTWTGWLAVTLLGIGLGAGFRLMANLAWNMDTPSQPATPEHRRRVHWGMMLNMLEPPAIIITLGLCLSQRAVGAHVNTLDVWAAFSVCVLPLLAIAAGGESLWIGCFQTPRSKDAISSDHDPSASGPKS